MTKRFILLAIVFATTLSLSAQRNMQVWEGNTYSEFITNSIDSVTFLLYPTGILRECETWHDTVFIVKKDTIYINTCEEDNDKHIGAFSVSADKQVAFSPGNLQYTQSTKTWSFAEHQYDMIGAANLNLNDSTLADKIDLFSWSGTFAASFGVRISTEYGWNDNEEFLDWGTNTIGSDAPHSWRTMTSEEWNYLCQTRTNANNLVGVARIVIDSSTYVNGLIFLPDAWVCPASITFKSGFATEHSEQAYADHQTIPLVDWQKMEKAGAIFLPAAGGREGDMWNGREIGFRTFNPNRSLELGDNHKSLCFSI